MTKTINIPARLHSAEQGNTVAGANEILDDTKAKKQNVINQETDAELLRLEQAKQDNLTFDNTPTENSTNPVTSGGVYAADKVLSDAIEAILLLIPSAATALNQLADKAFVNSSISTATATFRGTYNSVTDLHLAVDASHAQIEAALATVIATADNNDYCFVQIPVSVSSTDVAKTERYKYNGTAWSFEYELNTSGFTAAQWAAINSGITQVLVLKLSDLPTATELTQEFSTKQDNLTFDNAPTENSNNPVKSGGVYTVCNTLSEAIAGILELIPSGATTSNKLATAADITAITNLIPAAAASDNQLADKAFVLAKILEATPAFKGQFTALADLQAVQSPKAGDLGIVRTTDSDGYPVFTFYQYLNNQWNVFYTLSHHNQNKPATTGTTGDYPYNGMGRVVLEKNLVGGVPTLTQDMFKKGPAGNRVDNTNTIFVIQYDFELAGAITIPVGCVLEFDGGSISGTYSIAGNNTQIKAQDVAIFKDGVVIDGSWVCPRIPSDWFNDIISDNRLKQLINLSSDSVDNHIVIKEGTYVVSNTENAVAPIKPKSNTVIELLGSIQLAPNGYANGYIIGFENGVSNITVTGTGEVVGDYLRGHTGTSGEWGYNFELGDCSNITIDGITSRNAWGDGVCVGVGYRGNPSENITIRNCHIHTCRRQGISVVYANVVTIENNRIENIFGTAPFAAIDVECDSNTLVMNVDILNNFISNKKGISVSALANNIYNVKISNNNISYSKYHGISIESGYNINVEYNRVDKVTLQQTNPTDDDSTETTPVSIKSEINKCSISCNYVTGAVLGADIKNSVFNNNIIESVTSKFEDVTLVGNDLRIQGINSKNTKFCGNKIRCGYNAWGLAIMAENGIELSDNEIICSKNYIVVYTSGSESIIARNNKIVGDAERILIYNQSLDNPEIIMEGNVPATSYADNIALIGSSTKVNISCPASNRGTSTNRPTLHSIYKGHRYYDETIGKEIIWNGTGWTDMLGNDLSTAYIVKSGALVSGNVPEFDGTNGAVKDSGKAATNIP